MSKDNGGQAAGPENSGGDTTRKEPGADIYENRGSKKVVRLITVVAYMFSVSFVGIVLSAYYLFLWKPPNPRLIRRNRLVADPQVEFLLSDLSTFPNRSEESFDDVMANETFKRIVTEQMSFNDSEGWIVGRIAEDVHEENSPDSQEHRASRKLNKSLLILKNNLMDLLRGRIHHSTHHANSLAEKSKGSSESDNHFTNGNHVPFETDRSAVRNNNGSLQLKPSTISADEVNTGSPTGATNGAKREAGQSVGRAKNNSGDVPEEIYQRNRENIDSDSSNGTSGNTSNVGRDVLQSYTAVKVAENSSINPSDKPSINSKSTTAKTKKLSVYNRFSAGIARTHVKGDEVKGIAEDEPLVIKISGRNGIEGRSKSSRPRSFAMNSGETQIENLTAKSTIAVSERSQLELETVTTQRQKSLLTILLETTSTDIISSTTPEDLHADPSPSIKTHLASTT